MRHRAAFGFTLIEIMIVVAIVAILAAMVVPSMTRHMNKAKRAGAAAGLSSMQLQMERFRADNPDYPSSSTYLTDLANLPTAEDYTLAVTSDASPSTYTLEATAADTSSDTECATMTLTYTDGDMSRTPADCF